MQKWHERIHSQFGKKFLRTTVLIALLVLVMVVNASFNLERLGHLYSSTRWITGILPTQTIQYDRTPEPPPDHANGLLAFLNTSSRDITLMSSSSLRSKNGIGISFQGPITVLAAIPEIVINAYAIEPGEAGTMPVLDLVEPCCAPGIVVKNISAWTLHTSTDTSSQIYALGQSLRRSLLMNAQTYLEPLMLHTEHVIPHSLECATHFSTSQQDSIITLEVTGECHEALYKSIT